MFFFLGLLVLLDRVLNGAWCFSNHRLNHSFFSHRGRSCLDHFSNHGWLGSDWRSSGSQFGFLLQTLFFTLATTHFTWVVWRAAAWRQSADRCWSFNHRGWRFGHHGCFDNRCFNDRCWFGSLTFFKHRGFKHWRFNNRCFHHWRWGFSNSRFGNPVEGSLLFANFTHGFGYGFCDGFNHRLRSHNWRWLYLRQGLLNWSHFDFRSSNHFYWSSRFNNRRFHWSGFLNSRGGAFSLLVGLSFSRCTDHGAGNSGGHSQASSQIGSAWRFSVFAGFGFFRTFDHVAVGITLTLTTVAATTLTARTTTWAIAFGVLRTVFRQLLFVGVHFFFSDGSSGLFGTRLTLFTWRTRCAFFTWLTGRAFFSGNGNVSYSGWNGVQWLA